MRRTAAPLTLILVLLAASFLITDRPVSGAEAATENTWTTKAPMNVARSGLGVATVNGKIYAIGGGTSKEASSNALARTNEEYDTVTGNWTYKSPMSTARDYFAIAAYQEKIYCIGGIVGYSFDAQTQFYTEIPSGVNEVYDTTNDSWETKSPLPESGKNLQANVVDGKIFVMGTGWLKTFTYVYDPTTDSWSNRTAIPYYTATSGALSSSAVVGKKIIVTGEFYDSSKQSPFTDQKILIYDTETDAWSQGKSGPAIVSGGAAGATSGAAAPMRVYILGLAGNFPAPSVNLVYDPTADAWSTAKAMPTRRTDFAVTVANDVMYAIGGYYITNDVSGQIIPIGANEQYTPFGYGTVSPEIVVTSPENKTYTSGSITLDFTVNKPASWISYSLDGQENVTVTGNTTLSDLSGGLHNVTVYAKDAFGNEAASETITFTVEEPFPTVPVVAAVVIAITVAAGLLLARRKHTQD